MGWASRRPRSVAGRAARARRRHLALPLVDPVVQLVRSARRQRENVGQLVECDRDHVLHLRAKEADLLRLERSVVDQPLNASPQLAAVDAIRGHRFHVLEGALRVGDEELPELLAVRPLHRARVEVELPLVRDLGGLST